MSSSTWDGLLHPSFMETTLKWWKTSLVRHIVDSKSWRNIWQSTNHLLVSMCTGRKSVQQGLGTSRLPTFSPQEKSYIKGTCDFLGIGHFTTRYITQKSNPSGRSSGSYFTDRDLAELVDPRWPDPGSEWLYSVPWGFRRLLNFVKVTKQTCWHLWFTTNDHPHWNYIKRTCCTSRCFSQSRLSMGTPWFMWPRMESPRRCCAQSCVMTGGYSITKTTSMRCSKVSSGGNISKM